MKLLQLVLVGLILTSCAALAQRQYDVWYFGLQAGIDFSSGTPVPLTDGAMEQLEGCASIADGTTGQLLFYTDGITVWTRNHTSMPNGNLIAPLLGGQSSTQSALIVPKPGDSTIYYIFTADEQEDEDQGIHYSIVDMTLNGGLGDVALKNTPLLSNSTEKLVGVMHTNGCEVWVVAHGVEDNRFYAYLVTSAGVSTTPVISAVGAVHPTGTGKIGYLKASPDGRSLVSIIAGEYINSVPTRSATVELFNFDRQTGAVTFRTALPQEEQEYGASFSPDNSKLYISRFGTDNGGIYQYDLSSGDLSQIKASKTYVTTQTETDALQIGPDGRIYVARNGKGFLDVITNPNAAGTACGYTSGAVDLAGRRSAVGLPNNIDSYNGVSDACKLPIADFTVSQRMICAGECVEVIDKSRNSPLTWQWTFSGGTPATSNQKDPGTVCFDTPGPHTITLFVTSNLGNDLVGRDSAVIVYPLPDVDAGNDTTICLGRSAQLRGTGGTAFEWLPTDGLSCTDCADPVATPSATTTYFVTVTDTNGCSATDSMTVTVTEAAKPTITPSDTVVLCSGDSTPLSVNESFADYVWSTGQRGPTITVSQAGAYAVTATAADGCRSVSDSVIVQVKEKLEPTISTDGPTTFCEGDSVVLSAPAGFPRYLWSTLDTTRTIAVTASGSYAVTVTASGGCSETSPSIDIVAKPSPNPLIQASGPTSVCDGDSVVLDVGENFDTYRWSTGETEHRIVVTTSGTYSVTVTNAAGCTRTSSPVDVSIGQPSSATIQLPTLDASPGDLVAIQLEIPESANLLNSCAREFTAKIRFNKTLLKPVGNTPMGTVEGNDRVLTLTGNRDQATPTGTLAHLDFIVALGNADSTPLTIETFDWDRGNVVTTLQNGVLHLMNLCREGDLRLVNGDGTFGLKPARPNPASSLVEIEYGIVESGRTRLSITDIEGREVARPVDAELMPGRYLLRYDLSNLPSGIYFCTLQTPTQQQQERMMVVR